MLDIIALVASTDARARSLTSVGRRAKVRLVTSPCDLADAVARTMPSAVICEFSDETGAGTAAAYKANSQRFLKQEIGADARAGSPQISKGGKCDCP